MFYVCFKHSSISHIFKDLFLLRRLLWRNNSLFLIIKEVEIIFSTSLYLIHYYIYTYKSEDNQDSFILYLLRSAIDRSIRGRFRHYRFWNF